MGSLAPGAGCVGDKVLQAFLSSAFPGSAAQGEQVQLATAQVCEATPSAVTRPLPGCRLHSFHSFHSLSSGRGCGSVTIALYTHAYRLFVLEEGMHIISLIILGYYAHSIHSCI